MAADTVATSVPEAVAGRIDRVATTLDGVAAFLEAQVQQEDLQASRLAFTMAETVKYCMNELEECDRNLRRFAQ